MKRTAAIALAVVIGGAGVAETMPQARASEASASPRTLEQVRANALAAMEAGELQQVQKRGRAGRRGFAGRRNFGRNRGWRGRSSYRSRGYSGRRYGYRRRGGGGAAVAAGVAGLAVGAIIAGSANRSYRSSSYCEERFKSYNPRTGTYLGYDGRRHACP